MDPVRVVGHGMVTVYVSHAQSSYCIHSGKLSSQVYNYQSFLSVLCYSRNVCSASPVEEDPAVHMKAQTKVTTTQDSHSHGIIH